MKVLFWTEQYLPHIGGIEVFADGLIRELTSRGHTFAVVTCKREGSLPDEDVVDGVPVYRFPFHGPLIERDLAAVSRLSSEIISLKKSFGPDLIHINTTQPSIFYHVHTVGHVDCPTLVTIHSPPTFVNGPHVLFGRLVREAAHVAAVSDATRNELLETIPEIADRTTTIHNGLPPPEIAPTPLQFDPVHVICAGRVVKEKGFDVALRAFSLFLDVFEDATLSIAGDGPERPNLETLTADLRMSGSVRFRGWIDRWEIPAFMNTATMVVVPSRWEEPFGLVALQAAQVARPVVATRVGGLPEVVLDGETGLVVEADSPELLCGAMLELARNREWAAHLGRQGRERALSQFTMARCADRYEEVYLQAGDKVFDTGIRAC